MNPSNLPFWVGSIKKGLSQDLQLWGAGRGGQAESRLPQSPSGNKANSHYDGINWSHRGDSSKALPLPSQGRIGGSLKGNWNFYPNPVRMRSTFWGENRGPTGNLNFYLHLAVTRGHFPSAISPLQEQKPVRTGGLQKVQKLIAQYESADIVCHTKN